MLHDIFNNFEKMISNLDSKIISLKNQIMSDDPKILPTLCVSIRRHLSSWQWSRGRGRVNKLRWTRSTGRHLSSWQWSTGRVNKLRWTRSTGRHLSSWQWSTGRGRVNKLRWTSSTGRHLSSWQWSTGRGRVNRLSSSFLLQVKQIHKSLNDKF